MAIDLSKLTPTERWQYVVEDEINIRQKMLWEAHNGPYPKPDEMQNWQPTQGVKPSKETLQAWWAAVEQVLREYSHQVANGSSPKPEPAELAGLMAGICGYLAVGKMPEPIRDALAEGRTQPGPTERRDIGLAVAYHWAANGRLVHNSKSIIIQDPTPTKTISGWFGVSPNTVRSWVRNYPPAFLGINDIDEEILAAIARDAGNRYASAGRSHAAISGRARVRP